MKDELAGKITIKFVGLKSKTYCYLISGTSDDKKAQTQKRVSPTCVKFEYHENCLEATQLKNKINCLEKKFTQILHSFLCYKKTY